MTRLTLIALIVLCTTQTYCQGEIFLFKKNHKTISTYSKGSYIAFQLPDKRWITGYISKVKRDSFYVQPAQIRYSLMSMDTLHYEAIPFAFTDIFAMPKTGVQVDYRNGQNQVLTDAGHMHWYWVKNGWIFRVGAAGYVVLDAANGLIRNDFSFSGSKYGIAAAIFLLGEVLHLTYKVTYPIGRKYHFVVL